MAQKVKKQKKFQWQQAVAMVFFVAVGAVCGVLIAMYIDTIAGKSTGGEDFLRLIVLFLGLIVAIYLQTVIHEAGHLVFGLLTGYQFSSFRVASFMWVKERGKIRFRRLTIAGTGGQCLMVPPDLVDGKMPVVWYNLGGSLMNLIAAAVCLGLWALLRGTMVGVFLLIMAIVGTAFALMNGIPMRMGTVDNDGYNALSLGRNPAAMRALWVQLKCNEQLARGVRLKDMPEEWFILPADEDLGNSLVAAISVFACNRLMDAHRFEEADALMERYLNMDTGIVGLHKSLLICDRIYCELIGENRTDKLDSLLTKEQKKFMKAMKKFPSVVRTQYVYTLIGEKESAKVEQIKKQFEQVAKTYPYPSDVQAEREFMAIAEKMQA